MIKQPHGSDDYYLSLPTRTSYSDLSSLFPASALDSLLSSSMWFSMDLLLHAMLGHIPSWPWLVTWAQGSSHLGWSNYTQQALCPSTCKVSSSTNLSLFSIYLSNNFSSENPLGQVPIAKGQWMSVFHQCWAQPFSMLVGEDNSQARSLCFPYPLFTCFYSKSCLCHTSNLTICSLNGFFSA